MDRNYFSKKYQSIQQIRIILQFQYVTKATFSSLQTIKVTFLILHHFPVLLPPVVLPLASHGSPASCPPRCRKPGGFSVTGRPGPGPGHGAKTSERVRAEAEQPGQ